LKIKRIHLLSLFFLLAAVFYAQESSKPLTFSLTTDFYEAPESAFIADSKTHFAPVTGIYSAFGMRTTFKTNYRIDAPLAQKPLLNDSHFNLEGSIELTPLTIVPGIKTTWVPFPFMELSMGTQAGSGWNLGSMGAIAEYNPLESSYVHYPSFSALYFKSYAQMILQMDTGFIWPGDWNHVVMQYTYQAYYNALFGTVQGNLWYWPPEENKYSGWSAYQCLIIAYQMPLVFYRVGFMLESDKHYSDENLLSIYKYFNGTFDNLSLSQIMQFQFSQKDILSMAITFATRRGFIQQHTKTSEEPLLTYAVNEWYFKRVAFSWTHTF